MQDNKEIRNEHMRHNSMSDDPDQVRMRQAMNDRAQQHSDSSSQQQMDQSNTDNDQNQMNSGNQNQQSR